MKKKPLLLNFTPYSDANFQTLAYRVVTSMTANENFPDAHDAVHNLERVADQYSKALADAGTGDRVKISFKNDVKALLIIQMRALGEYVISKANGSETALLTSGFPIPTNNGTEKLQRPDRFIVLPGKNGEIILKIKRVTGVKAYVYQYTTNDPYANAHTESHWQSVYETKSKTTIKDLPLGVQFWFRVGAIGRGGEIVYTFAISRYIS
jgi:hypothetical protein